MVRCHRFLIPIFILTFPVEALTRHELLSRYNRPVWKQTEPGGTTVIAEQFVPETGVSLMVRYDAAGNVKELRIVPQGAESDEHGTRYVKPETAERLLGQLVAKRLQPPEAAPETTGPCERVTRAAVNNVTITREFNDCAPKGLNITVTWR